MKLTLIAFTTASILFLSSCGNGSESSSTNTDTSTTTNNSASEHPTATHDTATSGTGLMKPMNDMMTKMHSVQMTGDFDVDWANLMAEHHQSAIDMAQVELSQGKDEKMKAKAQEIITKQIKEVQELRDFVKSYKPSGMKHREGDLQKSMQSMMDKMKSMEMTGDIDKDFATMMISHHEDGVAMAKMEVKNGMADQLKKMAQNVITDQQKEIKEFQSWLSSKK